MKNNNLIEYQTPYTIIIKIVSKRSVLTTSPTATLEQFSDEESLYD